MNQTSLKSNCIYNIAYQILAILIPLITSPYLSRVVGAEGLGTYTYVNTIASYFLLFIMLGLNNYGNREIARVRDNNQKTKQVFSEIVVLQFSCGFIVSIAYFLYVVLFVKEYANLYWIQLILIVATGFDINWCCFGLEKFRLTVIRNSIIKVMSALLIFVLVKNSNDVWIYALVLSISTLLSHLAIWPFILKDIGFVRPTFKNIVYHVKPNFVLFLPVVAVSLYTMMDKLMLGIICDKSEVGFYDYAERIISIPRSFIVAIGTVMLPRASNMLQNGKEEENNKLLNRTMMFTLIFCVYFMFIMLWVSNKFIPWYYGSNYERCATFTVLLAPMIVLNAWNNTIRTQYIIPHGYDKVYLCTVSVGAACNVLMNIMLIPIIMGKGAVIATVVSEGVVCMVQFLFMKGKIDYLSFVKELLSLLFLGLIMVFALNLLSISFHYVFVELFFECFCGAIIYSALVFLYFGIKKLAINK